MQDDENRIDASKSACLKTAIVSKAHPGNPLWCRLDQTLLLAQQSELLKIRANHVSLTPVSREKTQAWEGTGFKVVTLPSS